MTTQLVKRYLPEFKVIIPLLNECSDADVVQNFLKLTSSGILYEFWTETRWLQEFLLDPVRERGNAKSELFFKWYKLSKLLLKVETL